MNSDQSSNQRSARAERFISHALVEVRRFRHIPFFCSSAVLLDLSMAGFKIEFTGSDIVHPGQKLWLSIPLGPLGILGPTKLLNRIEVRWYDAKRRRVGGVLMDGDKASAQILQQIIETLRERGKSVPHRG
jgi:hypothetical protein